MNQARVSERPRGRGGEGAGALGGECGGVSWPGDPAAAREELRGEGPRERARGPQEDSGGSAEGAPGCGRTGARGEHGRGRGWGAGRGERASGGGGRRRRRGWGSGLGGCAGSASAAAARARGAGGSAPRARPLWEPLPSAPRRSPPLRSSPGRAPPPPPPLLPPPAGLSCSGSQGKARGEGLTAGSLPVRGVRGGGRARRWVRRAAAPDFGRPAAAGRRVDRRGHRGPQGLAPAAPAVRGGGVPSARSGGLPAAGAARARGRRVL